MPRKKKTNGAAGTVTTAAEVEEITETMPATAAPSGLIAHQRRALYYKSTVRPLFNPESAVGEPFDVIDVSEDIANHTKINHRNTDEVRELLRQAKVVIVDNPLLADACKSYATQIAVIEYGTELDTERNSLAGEPVTVGLMHYTDGDHHNNAFARDMLNSLGRPLYVFGKGPDLKLGAEVTQVNDLAEFAALVDIVLLPSVPRALNSPTLAYSLMSAGCIIVATNTTSYYGLNQASGAHLVAGSPLDAPGEWERTIAMYENNRQQLILARERNIAHARQVRSQAQARIQIIQDRYI